MWRSHTSLGVAVIIGCCPTSFAEGKHHSKRPLLSSRQKRSFCWCERRDLEPRFCAESEVVVVVAYAKPWKRLSPFRGSACPRLPHTKMKRIAKGYPFHFGARDGTFFSRAQQSTGLLLPRLRDFAAGECPLTLGARFKSRHTRTKKDRPKGLSFFVGARDGT